MKIHGYEIKPGVSLKYANLAGANLEGANLKGANLTGVKIAADTQF